MLDKAAHSVFTNDTVAFPALWYGPDHGDLRLRKHLAAWLSDFYRPKNTISSERVAITGGASQNLACILQVCTDPVYTRNAWIVSPAYHLSFRIFEDAGLHKKLRAIPEDNEGIDIEFLKTEIKKSEDRARREGNNEPVCLVIDAESILSNNSTGSFEVAPCAKLPNTLYILTIASAVQVALGIRGQDLQTRHLCRANVFESIFQDDEPEKTRAASPSRQGVRRACNHRRCL